MNGFVYVARQRDCGKEYVGVTIRSPETRWLQHLHAAAKGSRSLFHQALRECGAGSFDFSVLWSGLATELGVKEQEFIAKRSTLMPFGYNMTPGGAVFGGRRLAHTRNMLWLGVADLAADAVVIPWLRGYKFRLGSRGVCLLSFEEVVRFIDFHTTPSCKMHHHGKFNKIKVDGGYKFLELSDGTRTHYAMALTEMTGMVQWDWTLKGTFN